MIALYDKITVCDIIETLTAIFYYLVGEVNMVKFVDEVNMVKNVCLCNFNYVYDIKSGKFVSEYYNVDKCRCNTKIIYLKKKSSGLSDEQISNYLSYVNDDIIRIIDEENQKKYQCIGESPYKKLIDFLIRVRDKEKNLNIYDEQVSYPVSFPIISFKKKLIDEINLRVYERSACKLKNSENMSLKRSMLRVANSKYTLFKFNHEKKLLKHIRHFSQNR